MDSRLKRLSQVNRLKNNRHEIIIDGEIMSISLPRRPNINPRERINQLKGIANKFDGAQRCFLYLILLADGWKIDDTRIRSPFWLLDGIDFKWNCAPEYLKCLKSLRERILKTYSITKYGDSGSGTLFAQKETNEESS